MKIDFSTSAQQTQTELNEKFFSISDPAFVFDLLRNKIYSNPILAVCRELSCNALDAHREVGKGDVPIVITLPTHQDPYFKVRDFGPGISPSRIDDIYLKYAASTKRDSNDQIGAFGIGAKSPFSYSESFTIVTNHDGKCYNYMAFIDESRMGKLILLSESETTDQNGTEIIVPVKSVDILTFQENVEKCTRHWSVKPQILGSKLQYRNIDRAIGTNEWFISSDRENYYERKVKVLVGEIEYNLDSSAIKSFCDISILSAISCDIYLAFQVGDVSLAANRESVYLDAQTKKAISSRMAKIKSEYISIINDKIASQPTYLDACYFVNSDLRSLCEDIRILGTIKWNGMNVISQISRNENVSIWEFSQRKSHWSDSVKITRRYTGALSFSSKSKIIIHDCGPAEPSSRHVKQFFQELGDSVRSIYVIQPSKSGEENFDFASFMRDEGFEIFNFERLSKYNKQIKSKKTSEKTKMILYKMDSYGSFNLTSQSEASSDTNKKLFVYLRKDSFRNKRHPVNLEKQILDFYQLKSILDMDKGVSIYGVDENVEEERVYSALKSVSFVTDYVDDWANNLDKETYFNCIWAEMQASSSSSECGSAAKVYASISPKVLSQESAVVRFANHYNSICEIYSKNKGLLSMLHSLGKANLSSEEFEEYCRSKENVTSLHREIRERYPLISAFDAYKSHLYVDDLANYVNLIDKSISHS